MSFTTVKYRFILFIRLCTQTILSVNTIVDFKETASCRRKACIKVGYFFSKFMLKIYEWQAGDYICMARRWLLKYSDTGISDKVFKYSDTAISGKVSLICTASHVLIYLLFFILISKRCFVPMSSLFQQRGWTVE